MEEMAYALQAMEDLLARRRKERMENEAVRERTRQFDVTAEERARAHDIQLRQQDLMEKFRTDQLGEQTRQHNIQAAENLLPSDDVPESVAAQVRQTPYAGILRTIAPKQAAVGAGVLETQPSEPGYPEETPQLFQGGRITTAGGPKYQEQRVRAQETAERGLAAEQERLTRQREHDETLREIAAGHDAARRQGDQGRPYFQAYPIYDSGGVPTGALRFNARTGTMEQIPVPGGGQIKQPPGSLGKDIVGQEVASTQLGRLKGMFKPEYVGPAAGRIGMIRQQTPLVPQNEGFSNFAAATAAFRNSVIKAITGAQMSEPEANRIRQQIPEVTDPPTVWQAKAAQTEKNLADLERIVQSRRAGTSSRTVIKRQRNRATGQTRVVYSDGTVEMQ